ncbi:TetR family transcriptional regulator [Microbacterium sp. CH12i]|uniref:TetR family transcriptional regulator n=1 Tax=Microbacterium sp. CH12i TaxID=1479651 RepID=UPI000461F514|nr:TetR family transcriptional regulator [Microbacterium sp. CH12i]KDA04751.1 TetR family transcriptional regulator [Microbacterium sp. CH12i]
MNAAQSHTRYSKPDVVAAAMRVLAEQGLPGLSMRRIAEVLDVQVSALYWHFPNKQALLAAVSAQIVNTGNPDAAPDLAAIATALRDRLLAHRDGAEIVSSSLALGLLELPSRASLVEAGRNLGLDEGAAAIAADTLVHFVIGYTFHEQQRMHAAVLGAADASVDLVPARVEERVDAFEAGLAMVVAGVREARQRMSHESTRTA